MTNKKAKKAWNTYSCPKCSKTFRFAKGLEKHLSKAHAGASAVLALPAPSTVSQPGTYPCPKCDKVFTSTQGLGSHLWRTHKVNGSVASKTNAKKSAPLPAAPQTDAPPPIVIAKGKNKGKLQCPECEQLFDKGSELGKHRRARHGVLGRYARLAANPNPPADTVCPDCGKVFSSSNGLIVHRSTMHKGSSLQIVKPTVEGANSIHGNRQAGPSELNAPSPEVITTDHLALALAIGSIKEFCRHSAEEHGIPTKLFTRQCAELFLREARR